MNTLTQKQNGSPEAFREAYRHAIRNRVSHLVVKCERCGSENIMNVLATSEKEIWLCGDCGHREEYVPDEVENVN